MQGVGITSPLVHVVPRVNVDQASLAVCIEDASSTLQFRGMVFGMLPRLPWSGNPVPLWQLWDSFGMDKATMLYFHSYKRLQGDLHCPF